MSKSSDPRHFFESEQVAPEFIFNAQQAKRERRDAKSSNKYGKPIVLKSKILSAIADPRSSSSAIFVAESAGSVRNVKLGDEPDIRTVYRGPSAPVTCVALGGPNQKTLFAGSWDKCIWSWDIDSQKPARKYAGHTDFIKTIVTATLGGTDILISGGADKRIIVWDVSTGKELHVLQDSVLNMLAVQSLAIDPVQTTLDEVYLFSASSDPHIRRWKISLDSWKQVVDEAPQSSTERRTLLEHETSIYKLVFDQESDEVDLWTASGDGTAKCLARGSGFVSDDVFEHGDHIKALAVTGTWVVTAGRDEDIKFWDRSTGKSYCSMQGHYDEVTDMVIVGDSLCSVGIDGTIRTWPLTKAPLDVAIKEQDTDTGIEDKGKEVGQKGLLSIEEEAELAALMEED
ncbi:hypothetical protein PspLS_05733 [Pyricularia sp. CBS 133598]|nr:hypothetical protein PspLS_05733 [Pyricularia sp. CBS 133598]